MIYSFLIHAVVAIGTALGIYSLPHAPVANLPIQSVDLGVAVQPIAGTTYTLSGSGLSSSATSIVLSSLTIPQTGQKIQDSDLSDTFYVTIEPGNRTRQEVSSCTTVVQNSNGTATLSGCSRGLAPITPYTASTSLQFAHSGGASLIFSDPPQLFNQYPAKANDETITGSWSFPTTPSSSNNPATKAYADSLAFGGVPAASETSSGFSELATQLEAASSTSSGSAARLVLGGNIATSSYNSATAPLRVVVTQNSGKIDNNFISTSTLLAATSTINIGAFPAWQIGKQFQIFSSTGTTTFSVPSGITKIFVELVAGGGAAGSGASGNISNGFGGGGGAGGYANKIVDVTGTSTIQLYVGAASQWSTFGTNGFYFYATPGSVGTNSAVNAAGGTGGIGTNGDVNIRGGSGGNGNNAVTCGSSCGAASSPPQASGGASYFGGMGAYGAGGGPVSETQGVVIIRW